MISLVLGLVLATTAPGESAPKPSITPYQPPPRLAPAPLPPGVTVSPRQGVVITPQGIIISPQGSVPFAVPDFAEAPPMSQHPAAQLDGRQLMRLRSAQRLRMAGQLAAAHDTLLAMLAITPHHPIVLDELARVESARGDWTAVEKLARAERQSQRDSLLLGRHLAQALEQLKRPRETAAIVLECWQVAPSESEWAVETLNRVVNGDSKGVRELVRKAAAINPDRVDIESAAAALDWKMGDGATAMRSLASSDRPGLTPPLRWRFADALLNGRYDMSRRMLAAKRVMDVHRARGTEREGAPALYAALKDLPPGQWNAELLLDVARGLRAAGQTAASRALLDTPDAAANARPRISLERALDDLHEGPPEAALTRLHDIAAAMPEARFRFAEALFFAGLPDSALAEYKRVTVDPTGPFTGAAFDRMYLIEDCKPKTVLPAIGRLMYMDWRGDSKVTLAAGDSLYLALPHAALWGRIAIFWRSSSPTTGWRRSRASSRATSISTSSSRTPWP